MPVRFTDEEIMEMLNERKQLPENYRARLKLKEKRGHKERELEVDGENGGRFKIILRQSNSNFLDFSAILAVNPPNSNLDFRLRRYNGKSHEHTNNIEGDKFFDFHIHQATMRYQERGMKEDSYAESTDRYSDLESALHCLIMDCGFERPPNPQPTLFEGID